MTKIKICGIQTIEHAQCVSKAGANYIGFVFAKSKRQVTPDQAKKIIQTLPPTIEKVGVFVNTPLKEMEKIADYCGLDILQLHGDEKQESYQQSKYPIIKSISIKTSDKHIINPLANVQFLLFDTWHKNMRGGCGESFKWSLLKKQTITTPYFLAGGLSIDNVKEAIRNTAPYAVDISSGVETNGLKDNNKIKQFIQTVKEYQDDL